MLKSLYRLSVFALEASISTTIQNQRSLWSPWFSKFSSHVSVVAGDRKCTWVEENDGAQAAQLGFVHLHVSHLADELRQNPGERRAARTRAHFQLEIPVGRRKRQTRVWHRRRERRGEKVRNGMKGDLH